MSFALSVLKIGGSVLTGPDAYTRAAGFVAARLRARAPERILAVVSAELGVTDSLLATATSITGNPDPGTLDLLWSTGELRSAALLALSLQAAGIRAAAVNVHQTGLVDPSDAAVPGMSRLRPLRLRALLAVNDVEVAPGFLARGAGDRIVSLGRGGSDLTAVLLAAGLGAARCELLKDVPGYFTADPKHDPEARPLESLTFSRAIAMADEGCELVQRQALVAAREHGVQVLVSAMTGGTGTWVRADN